jgi:hypothetical protein
MSLIVSGPGCERTIGPVVGLNRGVMGTSSGAPHVAATPKDRGLTRMVNRSSPLTRRVAATAWTRG